MKLQIANFLSIGFAISLAPASAVTTLTSDDFEVSLGNWSVTDNAGLYSYGGTGTNYATSGTGAAFVDAQWTEGVLTLTDDLSLNTNQATSVTISLDYHWSSITGTRSMYIDYTLDGGATWTNSLGNTSGWGEFTAGSETGSFTKTLNETTVGSFTDGFRFRIRGKDGNSPVTAYIDNLVISGADVIPEPSAALLGSLGALLLLRRRRD